MRKTRLVLVPGVKSIKHLGCLLLFLACPNIAFQGQEKRDIEPICTFSELRYWWLPVDTGDPERLRNLAGFQQCPIDWLTENELPGSDCKMDKTQNKKQKKNYKDSRDRYDTTKRQQSLKRTSSLGYPVRTSIEESLTRILRDTQDISERKAPVVRDSRLKRESDERRDTVRRHSLDSRNIVTRSERRLGSTVRRSTEERLTRIQRDNRDNSERKALLARDSRIGRESDERRDTARRHSLDVRNIVTRSERRLGSPDRTSTEERLTRIQMDTRDISERKASLARNSRLQRDSDELSDTVRRHSLDSRNIVTRSERRLGSPDRTSTEERLTRIQRDTRDISERKAQLPRDSRLQWKSDERRAPVRRHSLDSRNIVNRSERRIGSPDRTSTEQRLTRIQRDTLDISERKAPVVRDSRLQKESDERRDTARRHSLDSRNILTRSERRIGSPDRTSTEESLARIQRDTRAISERKAPVVRDSRQQRESDERRDTVRRHSLDSRNIVTRSERRIGSPDRISTEERLTRIQRDTLDISERKAPVARDSRLQNESDERRYTARRHSLDSRNIVTQSERRLGSSDRRSTEERLTRIKRDNRDNSERKALLARDSRLGRESYERRDTARRHSLDSRNIVTRSERRIGSPDRASTEERLTRIQMDTRDISERKASLARDSRLQRESDERRAPVRRHSLDSRNVVTRRERRIGSPDQTSTEESLARIKRDTRAISERKAPVVRDSRQQRESDKRRDTVRRHSLDSRNIVTRSERIIGSPDRISTEERLTRIQRDTLDISERKASLARDSTLQRESNERRDTSRRNSLDSRNIVTRSERRLGSIVRRSTEERLTRIKRDNRDNSERKALLDRDSRLGRESYERRDTVLNIVTRSERRLGSLELKSTEERLTRMEMGSRYTYERKSVLNRDSRLQRESDELRDTSHRNSLDSRNIVTRSERSLFRISDISRRHSPNSRNLVSRFERKIDYLERRSTEERLTRMERKINDRSDTSARRVSFARDLRLQKESEGLHDISRRHSLNSRNIISRSEGRIDSHEQRSTEERTTRMQRDFIDRRDTFTRRVSLARVSKLEKKSDGRRDISRKDSLDSRNIAMRSEARFASPEQRSIEGRLTKMSRYTRDHRDTSARQESLARSSRQQRNSADHSIDFDYLRKGNMNSHTQYYNLLGVENLGKLTTGIVKSSYFKFVAVNFGISKVMNVVETTLYSLASFIASLSNDNQEVIKVLPDTSSGNSEWRQYSFQNMFLGAVIAGYVISSVQQQKKPLEFIF